MQRVVPLHVFDKQHTRINPIDNLPTRPLITGHGAGTNRALAPARIIAEDVVDGVDVVTAVTEAVLSFSGLKVKLDMNNYIGDEGRPIKHGPRTVGYVTASEYGSRTLSVGGVGLLKSNSGFSAARVMTDIANKKRVKLKVKKGSEIEFTVNQVPVVDGQSVERTSIGCGSSIGKLFSHHLIKLVDECIMLDPGITGQMSYHHASVPQVKPTGITVAGKMSTPGRYMVPPGSGLGGTIIKTAREAIAHIDKNVAWPGLRILVTDTMIGNAAYLVLDDRQEPVEQPLTEELNNMLAFMRTYCEQAKANAVYVGGIGGGVRGALHPDHSPRVMQAIKAGLIKLTAAGQKTYIMPGGNLVFMVDVGPMPEGCFAWVPTPATVIPIEFSMTKKNYNKICGYSQAVKPLNRILEEFDHVYLDRED